MPSMRQKRDEKESPVVTGKPIDDTAQVIETKRTSYKVKVGAPENANEHVENTEEFATPFVTPFAFAGHNSSIPRNSLPYLFEVLRDEGEASYICYVRRTIDLPSDDFLKPCTLSPINFPPFTITPQHAQSFISALQKMNGNSGGRFEVIITTPDNEIVESAKLNDFVVLNPVVNVEEQQNSQQQTLVIMQMFQQMQEQQNERFEKLLEQVKPQQSELDGIAHELLRRKLLESEQPKNAEFNPNKMLESLFTSQQFVEQWTAKMFREEPKEINETPPLLKWLETDAGKTVLDRGLQTVGNLATLFAMKAQQNSVGANTPASPANGFTGAPQHSAPPTAPNPQPATPSQIAGELTPEQRQTMVNTQNLINEIVDELLTDNPIDGTNEVMQDLAEQYPAVLPMIKMACQTQPYESLLGILKQAVPDTFAEFYNADGTPNSTGTKIESRLKVFYEYMKTSP